MDRMRPDLRLSEDLIGPKRLNKRKYSLTVFPTCNCEIFSHQLQELTYNCFKCCLHSNLNNDISDN